MHASRKGLADSVIVLLESGADLTAQDSTGLTALMLVAGQGSKETTLGRGSSLVNSNREKTAKLLLAAGVDITAKNNEGNTALTYAKENGREEIVALLEGSER